MKFTDYINDEPTNVTIEEKVVSKTTVPRNFKSYIKKIETQPVIVMCNEDFELIAKCQELKVKFHVIKGDKYLIEAKQDRVIIKDMFEENNIVILNQKNTILLEQDSKIADRLKGLGIETLDKKSIKEKLIS